MSTQYDNFSVSEINFIETFGDDLGNTGTHVIRVTPDSGYSIDVNDFSVVAPFSPYIDQSSIVLAQNINEVTISFNLLAGTLMPENAIEIPLCISGFATLDEFTINGNYAYATSGFTPPSDGTYFGQGPFDTTEPVLSQTINAGTGKYFPTEPQAAVVTGDANSYDIQSSVQTDTDGNVISKTFNITYRYPNQDISGNLIRFVANAVDTVDVSPKINSFTVDGVSGYNQPDITSAGETKPLVLIGQQGAQITSIDLYDTSAPPQLIASYGSNVSIPASGQYTENIVFPAASAGYSVPYRIVVVSPDINPNLLPTGATDIEITFGQNIPVSINVNATSTDPNLTLAGVPASIELSPNVNYTPGTEPVFNFSFTATTSAGEITYSPVILPSSFVPAIPDPAATDYSYTLTSLVPSLNTDSTVFTVTGSMTIYQTGNSSITHTIDLDNHLSTVELPTIVTTGVSNETGTGADSGGESITDGGGTISSKGIQWSLYSNFSSILGANDEGTGTADFTSSMTGLTTGTTYYVRAYAQNEAGVAYGEVIGFVPNITIPCSSTASPGGAGITDTNINLDSGGGLIAVLFDPIGVPDKLEIIHGSPNGGTKVATSAFDDATHGNSGPFDQLYGTEPSNTVPASSQVTNIEQFIGTDKGTAPTRQTEFTADTGYQVSSMTVDGRAYQQIVWWKYTASDWQNEPTVTIRVTGSGTTQWQYLRLCCPDSNCTVASTP